MIILILPPMFLLNSLTHYLVACLYWQFGEILILVGAIGIINQYTSVGTASKASLLSTPASILASLTFLFHIIAFFL